MDGMSFIIKDTMVHVHHIVWEASESLYLGEVLLDILIELVNLVSDVSTSSFIIGNLIYDLKQTLNPTNE